MTDHAFYDTTSDEPIETVRFSDQNIMPDPSRSLLVSKNRRGLVLALEVGEGTEKVRLVWPMPSDDVQRLRDFLYESPNQGKGINE